MIFKLSSKVPFWMPAKDYSCPWKWLLSRYVHPAASCFSLRAVCRHLQVLPDLCPVLCSAAGMGEPDSMIFPVGRITSEFGHCWKESSIVWHVNHDATCLTPLNINPPGNSSQESSHFTNVISNILCTTKYLRQKKKKLDFIETHSRKVMIIDTVESPPPHQQTLM